MSWARRAPTKMGNEETQGFASKREFRRYCDLVILQKIGEIRNLKTQVKFELTPKMDGERASHYIADFCYEEKDPSDLWVEVTEDSKGHRTQLYILKRKMMLYRYGIKIRET